MGCLIMMAALFYFSHFVNTPLIIYIDFLCAI